MRGEVKLDDVVGKEEQVAQEHDDESGAEVRSYGPGRKDDPSSLNRAPFCTILKEGRSTRAELLLSLGLVSYTSSVCCFVSIRGGCESHEAAASSHAPHAPHLLSGCPKRDER